ncbi:microfibril-associated glycoprotein 4-like [Pseudorasbora parva]|uniref:microfibril-associated glycoprotein 4-like n=1 Tax=Pseudorasbora parva TaxID=51549 RepID=UPI00351E2577
MMAMTVFVAALISVFTASVVSVPDGFKPADCSDLYKAGETVSGIYSIYITGDVPLWVYCHMVSDGKDEDNGGWTVFQRRMDGSVDFYRGWEEYKRGFGATEGEYWLGLENMHQLTRNGKYMLKVDLEDLTGGKGFAQYSTFSVGPETDGYRLQVSGFKNGGAGDFLAYHNGMKFSTFDKDQDTAASNCAEIFRGAFWYGYCQIANPNGLYLRGEDPTSYGNGVVWYYWRNTWNVIVKSIIMKIKRVA